VLLAFFSGLIFRRNSCQATGAVFSSPREILKSAAALENLEEFAVPKTKHRFSIPGLWDSPVFSLSLVFWEVPLFKADGRDSFRPGGTLCRCGNVSGSLSLVFETEKT
jgi:hypothetical protein